MVEIRQIAVISSFRYPSNQTGPDQIGLLRASRPDASRLGFRNSVDYIDFRFDPVILSGRASFLFPVAVPLFDPKSSEFIIYILFNCLIIISNYKIPLVRNLLIVER